MQAPDRRSCDVPNCTKTSMVLSVGTCLRCGEGERGQIDTRRTPSYTRFTGKCVRADGADPKSVSARAGDGDVEKCRAACNKDMRCTAFELTSTRPGSACASARGGSAAGCSCMLNNGGWGADRAVRGASQDGKYHGVCYVKNGPYNTDGEYYAKYNNKCVDDNEVPR